MNDVLFMMTNASYVYPLADWSFLQRLVRLKIRYLIAENVKLMLENWTCYLPLYLLECCMKLHGDATPRYKFVLTWLRMPCRPTPLSLCCSSHSVLLCRLISDLLWVPVRICNFLLRSAKPCFLIESNFVSLVPSESSNNIILCFSFFVAKRYHLTFITALPVIFGLTFILFIDLYCLFS